LFRNIALSSALTAATASAKRFGVKVMKKKQRQKVQDIAMHRGQNYKLSKTKQV